MKSFFKVLGIIITKFDNYNWGFFIILEDK